MKKKLLGLLLGAILIFVCAGCGAKSANTEQTEAAQTTTTEENSPKQPIEATATPVETELPTPEKAEKPSEEIAPEAEVPEATSEPTAEPVSNSYLSTEKVKVQQSTGGSGGGGNASAGVPDPFTVERRVWHDMGTYAFYVDTYYIRADVVYADRPTVLSDGSITYGGAGHHLNTSEDLWCWLDYENPQDPALQAFIQAYICHCGNPDHNGLYPERLGN